MKTSTRRGRRQGRLRSGGQLVKGRNSAYASRMPSIEKTDSSKSNVYSAPALEKGFNVIELLASAPHGLTVSEIASGLGISMSEIFRVIMVMERRSWLRKGASDRYSVTTKVLDLAFRATAVEELSIVAAPAMRHLSAAIDQSCHLVVINEGKGLVVLRQENPGPTGFAVRVGSTVELEATCSGHVLLAFSPQRNENGELNERLVKVRSRGYELMKSVRTLGVTDISCPIFGFDGHVVAALTVPFLSLIDGSQDVGRDDARARLVETAAKISESLGAR
jgi:DNA-binding IclR family transcriptional regulator